VPIYIIAVELSRIIGTVNNGVTEIGKRDQKYKDKNKKNKKK
jgi:hypothetical protein